MVIVAGFGIKCVTEILTEISTYESNANLDFKFLFVKITQL